MCISGNYAFTNISISTIENDINTGAVNIELKQYTTNNNGKEVMYNENEKTVLPGEVISIIPRVSNLGDSCYIRAKFSYTNINNTTVAIDKNVEMSNSNWIKCDDYWYYKLIVNPGENIDIFKTFKIPEDMSNEYQGETVQLDITAEAVQANNFEPDFSSSTPWNDITVKKAINDNYKTDKVQLNSNVKIKYENNAELYMNVPDNFFERLSHVLPGDYINQEIEIDNTTSNETEYFMSTNIDSNISEKAVELLKKLRLTITADNKILYDGSLYKVDNCSLGKYKPNTSSKVKFTITVPKELDNEYSEINTQINWVFSVTGIEKREIPKQEVISPQTGDTKFKISITVFFISTIGLITTFVVERKINRK